MQQSRGLQRILHALAPVLLLVLAACGPEAPEQAVRSQVEAMQLAIDERDAGAIDELLASGALEDPTHTYKDDITRELDALASDSAVENELAAMKAAMGAITTGGAAAATPQLPAAAPVDAEATEVAETPKAAEPGTQG